MRLRPGFTSELTALPRPPNWIWGREKSREKKRRGKGVTEKEGKRTEERGTWRGWCDMA